MVAFPCPAAAAGSTSMPMRQQAMMAPLMMVAFFIAVSPFRCSLSRTLITILPVRYMYS